MPTFAENNVNFPDGQINVEAPPDSLFLSGFIPEQAGARGMPLVAQWLNYLFRQLYRYTNRIKITDGNGVGLFPYLNSTISLQVIDTGDVSKFLYAIGYRSADPAALPFLRIVNSSGLTLGTATASGNYPINGGSSAANLKLTGINNSIGAL